MLEKITGLLSHVLGANWRTSSSGLLTLIFGVLAYVIHVQPELIAFLPDNLQTYILGIIKILVVVGGFLFVILVKDAKVTGGKIPQTKEAEIRIEGFKIGQKKNKKQI